MAAQPTGSSTPPLVSEQPPWTRLVDPSRPNDRERTIPPPSVRRVALQFVAGSLIAGALLLGFSVWGSYAAARNESLADARITTELLATLVIEPNITDGLGTGDPTALSRLDAVVEEQLRDFSVVRVKVWDDEQRIVYSDDARLIGRIFPLGNDNRPVRPAGTVAQISDLDAVENVFEQGQGQLLEVYRPLSTPAGDGLLLEIYFDYEEVTGRQAAIWLNFAPITAGTLLLLVLLLLLLAQRMVREVRAGDRERLRLQVRAAEAADLERRRIASGLHDGVVQDLSAAPLIMSQAVSRLHGATRTDPDDDRSLAADLRMATSGVRNSVASLRSLMIEIYPPNLARTGLHAALADLTARIRSRDVQTRLELPDDLDLPGDTPRLFFRIAQEALLNVVTHARARTAVLTMSTGEEEVTMVIRDDGVGFDPATVSLAAGTGHFGLAIMADLAAAAGATLDLATAPGRGTAIRLRVPLP
jgi:two-component system, NarL family, sensor kinase